MRTTANTLLPSGAVHSAVTVPSIAQRNTGGDGFFSRNLVGAKAVGERFAGAGCDDLRARAAAGMKDRKVAAPVAGAGDGLSASILDACTLPSMPPIKRAVSAAERKQPGRGVKRRSSTPILGADDTGKVIPGAVVKGTDRSDTDVGHGRGRGQADRRPRHGPRIVTFAAVHGPLSSWLRGRVTAEAGHSGNKGFEANAIERGKNHAARVPRHGFPLSDRETALLLPAVRRFGKDHDLLGLHNDQALCCFQSGQYRFSSGQDCLHPQCESLHRRVVPRRTGVQLHHRHASFAAFHDLGNPQPLAQVVAQRDADAGGALHARVLHAVRKQVLLQKAANGGNFIGGDFGEVANRQMRLARSEDGGDLLGKRRGRLFPWAGVCLCCLRRQRQRNRRKQTKEPHWSCLSSHVSFGRIISFAGVRGIAAVATEIER